MEKIVDETWQNVCGLKPESRLLSISKDMLVFESFEAIAEEYLLEVGVELFLHVLQINENRTLNQRIRYLNPKETYTNMHSE